MKTLIPEQVIETSIYDNVCAARLEAEKLATNNPNMRIASLADIAHMLANTTHPLWSENYNTNTEEYVGALNNGLVYVLSQGSAIFTAERIKTALGNPKSKVGLVDGAAKLTLNEFRAASRGEFASGNVNVISFADALHTDIHDSQPYVVLAKDEDVQHLIQTTSGERDIGTLVKNPLFIIRAGGPSAAKSLVQAAADRKYNNLCNYHHLEERSQLKQPSGSVLEIDLTASYEANIAGILDYFSAKSFSRFALVQTSKNQ